MTRASPSSQRHPKHISTWSGDETDQLRDTKSPQQHTGVRVALKMDEHNYLHRHSDPYESESDDVQRGIVTVVPGTASYRGGSRTRAITAGKATYMGGSQAMRAVTIDSGLEGRELMQKSARPDSPTGETVTM